MILAVGIASEGSPMIDADFVRIFYNKTSNQFDTEDAFLSKELNCDFVTGGLCADSKVLNSKSILSLKSYLGFKVWVFGEGHKI